MVRARLRLGVVAVVAASVVGTAAVASPAGADPGVPVEIVATLTGPNFSGVWSATGAFVDGGTFARVDANVSGSVEHSAKAGTVQVLLTFTGTRGTFALRDEIMISPESADGTWQVASGTGAYARMSGHGRSAFPFTADTITFTGTASPR
jgi:hypothetical protein